MTLNLGCGSNKIPECINIDINPKLSPDLVFNLESLFPIKPNSIDRVYLFHTIEHIEKFKWGFVLNQIHTILKTNGILYISYPEFRAIAKKWLKNDGNRDFWEHTIYGRQSAPDDYHVSLMDSHQFLEILKINGFKDITFRPEKRQDFNTVCRAVKGEIQKTYEQLLYEDTYPSAIRN